MIFLYQHYISPFFPSSCRFYPSCSEYAKQAFLKYGFLKASILTIYCKKLVKDSKCNTKLEDEIELELNQTINKTM